MYSEEQYYKALKVYEETKSVTKTITILGYPARRQTLYNWINRKRILPEGKSTFRGYNTEDHPRHPPLEQKLQILHRCFEMGEDVQSVSNEVDNLQRKYKKSQQICEVLKSVNCTPNSPLKTKLYELEKLYGKYSVHVLCEALDVNRGTFYNHILRNKKQNTSYVQRRAELSEAISKIYEESHGLFGSDKILSILHSQGYRTSKKMVRGLMKEMGLKSLRSRAKKDFKNWTKLHEHTNILKQKL